LKNSNDIITNDYREVEYWYPMQTLDLLEKKDYYVEQLKEKQIFVLWRFGEWKYYNLWDIIHSANILFKSLENEYFVF
jgi:UDP-galactopyranose mutase